MDAAASRAWIKAHRCRAGYVDALRELQNLAHEVACNARPSTLAHRASVSGDASRLR
jgi:hypothetical protein